MPLIELDRVSHRFGERLVLDRIDLRLEEPRIGVIGANGSGKSTFARTLNGLVVPDAGTVRVAGLEPERERRRVRRKVGFVFTDPDAQIVMPTVAEDLGFGLRRRGLARSEIAERVEEWLVRLGLDTHRDHPAHLLSGGQKQLLALGSVLVTEPELLVMDEPTTLLDLANARGVARVIAALSQQVLLVTHHLDLLADFDRVLVFDAGRVVRDGTPAEAVGHYRELVG